MPVLRQTLERLGLQSVQTYIQSGNVVFAGQMQRPTLEAAFAQVFGFAVPIMLRSAVEWAELIAANPYPLQAAADGTKVHLALLDAEPGETALAALRAVQSGADEWVWLGRALYLHTPDGLGNTRLNPDRLKVGVTTRNWRTVLRLGELAAE